MEHIKAIQGCLEEYELDAMLLLSPAARRYACGYGEGAGFVLVSRRVASCCVEPMCLPAARLCAAGAAVSSLQGSLGEAVQALAQAEGLRLIGFEETRVTVAELWALQAPLAARLIPAGALVAGLRLRKDRAEQRLLCRAQRLAERCMQDVVGRLQPGLRESRLRGALLERMLALGADEAAFPPVAAFGSRSACPHGLPGDAALEVREPVLVDLGCRISGYGGDLSRSLPGAIPSAAWRDAFRAVTEAQRAAEALLRADVEAGELSRAAEQTLEAGGYGGLMCHSLGHGVGLETHEPPFFTPGERIPAGAVVALEPGIYLPGRFGIRVEDCFVVTENGCRRLSGRALPG